MSKGAKYVTSGSNIAALIDAVQTQNKLVEDDGHLLVAQNFILDNIAANIHTTMEGIVSINEIMTGNHMKSLEADRENSAQMEALIAALKDNKKPEKKEEKKDGNFSWLGLAGALISGLVAGGMAFVTNYVKNLVKLWEGIAKALKIDGYIAKFFNIIKDGFTYIKDLVTGGFTKAWEAVKSFFGENKIVQAINNFITKVVEGVKAFFKVDELLPEFATLWQSIKDIFKMITEPIGKMFKGGGSFIDEILKSMEFLKPVTSFFKSIGAILGKLAVPLQIIMSIWDTVSGALDGWNKTEGSFMDKLLGAIKGGLTGLLNGLIGGLLDLLKDGLSWVLNFFGMKDAAAWLDSFSFSQIIEDVIGGLVDGFKNIVLGVIEVFTKVKDFFANIDWTGILKQGLGWLIVALTAGASSLIEGLTGWSLTSKALELAGVPDPRGGGGGASGGAGAQPVAASTSGQNSTQQLTKATGDNTQAKTDQASAAAAASVAASSNSSSKQTVVNNAGPTAVVSSKTTNWDPEDMWARGGMGMMGA